MSQSESVLRFTSAVLSTPFAAALGSIKGVSGASGASNNSLYTLTKGQSALNSMINAMEELRKADAGGG